MSSIIPDEKILTELRKVHFPKIKDKTITGIIDVLQSYYEELDDLKDELKKESKKLEKDTEKDTKKIDKLNDKITEYEGKVDDLINKIKDFYQITTK